MIALILSLYDKFKPWSEKGSIYIISDTHFDDPQCKEIDPEWPTPEEYMAKLKEICHKTDTLIHLGDVGNPSYFKDIKAHKVLIMGNHDESRTKFEPYFDEIYEGPLFIGEKILLSHEPIEGLPWCMNLHGHDHSCGGLSLNHFGFAANTVNYKIFSLGKLIKDGLLSDIDSLHRITIDNATFKKRYKNE